MQDIKTSSFSKSESIAVNMILTVTYNKYKSTGKQNPKKANIANMKPLHEMNMQPLLLGIVRKLITQINYLKVQQISLKKKDIKGCVRYIFASLFCMSKREHS